MKSEEAVEFFSREVFKDFLAITSISLGVVLIVGGLFLIISEASIFNLIRNSQSATQSMANTIDLIPGVPFSMSWPFELIPFGSGTIGIVTWVFGIDILLVGLGLWVRNKYAKLAAITIFGLAICFDVAQFLFYGFGGAPQAVIGATINGIIVFLLIKN